MMKRVKLMVCISFLVCLTYITIYYTDDFMVFLTFNKYRGFTKRFQQENHVLFTEGCKVPKFDPFDPTVVGFYKNTTGDIICKGKRYLNIEHNKVILDSKQTLTDFKGINFSCTYKAIYRNPKNETSKADNKFDYGKENYLHFNETLPEEFIKAFCRVNKTITHEEFLASTPLKHSVEERCNKNSAKILTPRALNIIVVGIDSLSKLNFERHFKRTAEYLRQNLSVFEYHGYMKVADNTFPNLTPLLTGHFVQQYYNTWNQWRYFDDLDFIWKNFSSIGYRTLFAEDAPDMGTYNYLKNGFQYPPTDYFLRPFLLAIEDTPWHKASNSDCFQAKPEIIVLFDYLRSFLVTMKDRPFFSFTWASRLTHDSLNKAGYADKPTFELLRDIKDMGVLNTSMLVFMSDHGIRFGGIRKTFIGKIEERMPFLFISFPNWFLEAHSEIKANLISNRRRIATPFDLHDTFVDVYQMMSGDNSYIRTPYGISLFRDIPLERNCKSAFILPHWCVCHEYKKISLRSHLAVNAAKALVTAVNDITAPHRNICEELTLDAILDARVTKPEDDLLLYNKLENGAFENSITYGKMSESFEKLMITVSTIPGNAEFESTIRKVKETFKVFDISRINMYGKKGDCVNDAYIRKYCQCK